MRRSTSDTIAYILIMLGKVIIYFMAITGIIIFIGSIGTLDFATETKSADPAFAWRNAVIGLLMTIPFLIRQFWKEIR